MQLSLRQCFVVENDFCFDQASKLFLLTHFELIPERYLPEIAMNLNKINGKIKSALDCVGEIDENVKKIQVNADSIIQIIEAYEEMLFALRFCKEYNMVLTTDRKNITDTANALTTLLSEISISIELGIDDKSLRSAFDSILSMPKNGKARDQVIAAFVAISLNTTGIIKVLVKRINENTYDISAEVKKTLEALSVLAPELNAIASRTRTRSRWFRF